MSHVVLIGPELLCFLRVCVKNEPVVVNLGGAMVMCGYQLLKLLFLLTDRLSELFKLVLKAAAISKFYPLVPFICPQSSFTLHFET